MLLTNWLKSIASHCRPFRPRHHRHQRSRILNRYQPALSRRMIGCEELEDRTMLTSMISINDLSWVEGDVGSTIVTFIVTRTGDSPGDLNENLAVDFTTLDGSAQSDDNDYVAVSGTLDFEASDTSTRQTKTIQVQMLGDYIQEGDESFQIVLSTQMSGVTFVKDTGILTIFDDEYHRVEETQTLAPPAPLIEESHFGQVIAVDGDYMVVSAPDSDLAGSDAGAAYIYWRNRFGTADETDDTWSYHSTLTAFDGAEYDHFGSTVAISGDTLVIGASGADLSESDEGAAYVYRLSGGLWQLESKLTASDAGAGDNFGSDVAIENDLIVIGADLYDVPNNSNSGAAYMFSRSGNTWSENQILTATEFYSSNNNFGTSVDIKNGEVFVAARRAKIDHDGAGVGSIFTFQNNAGIWEVQQQLTLSFNNYYDYAGPDLSVSGNHLAIIADDYSYVYMYENRDGIWEFHQQVYVFSPTYSQMQIRSIDLKETTLVVGSTATRSAADYAGAISEYNLIRDKWTRTQNYYGSSIDNTTGFGTGIAMADSQIITGAPNTDSTVLESGLVHVLGPFVPGYEISDVFEYEGDSGETLFEFTIERKASKPGDLNFASSIDFATLDGTATIADGDYQAQSGTLTFNADPDVISQTQTVTIVVNGDDQYEGGEAFYLELSNPTNGSQLLDPQGKASIGGDDYAIVRVAESEVIVNEADGIAQLTLTLDEVFSEDVVIGFSFEESSARLGDDFGFNFFPLTVTIPAGQLSATFSIDIVEDNIAEDDEQFWIYLHSGSNYRAVSFGPTIVKILNDDFIELSIDDAVVNENQSYVTLFVRASEPVRLPLVVYHATQDNSATRPDDYTSPPGGSRFATGDRTISTFTIPIVNDLNWEPNESFFVNLTGVSIYNIDNPPVVFIDNQAEVTIIDDDGPNVSIRDVTVDEDAGDATLTVSLQNAATFPINVDYTTANNTAIQTEDFSPTSGTVTFAPGETTVTFTVPIIDSAFSEETESFFVNLSNLVVASGPPIPIDIRDPQAEVTIIDDDYYYLTIGHQSVNEADGTVSLTVKLDQALPTAMDVDFSTINHTAIAGTDYQSTTGTVSFSPGETEKTITIPIIDDYLVENLEGFYVRLNNLQTNGSNVTINMSQAYVRIHDEDQYYLTIDDQTINESDGTATLTVTLDHALPKTLTVDYSSLGETATTNVDFQATTGTLTFNPGDLTKTITIPITDDAFVEGTETFFVKLSNQQTTGGVVSFIQDQSQITIRDDDQAFVSINDVTVNEDDGMATLTVTLDQTVNTTINIGLKTQNQTAHDRRDYETNYASLIFEPGETSKEIQIGILEDNIVELAETFLVVLELNNPESGAQILFTDNQSEITILDNDQATLRIADLTVDETDGVAIVKVSLDNPVSTSVSFDYETIDQTASSPDDFTSVNNNGVINPGKTYFDIIIPIIDDTQFENSETMLVNLTNLQASDADVIFADDQGIVTIYDSLSTQIDIQDISVDEDEGEATVLVTLTTPVDTIVNIDYTTANGSAVEISDFLARSGTLVFQPGETTKSVTIPIVYSPMVEPDKFFNFKVSNFLINGTDTLIEDDQVEIEIHDRDRAKISLPEDFSVQESDGLVTVTLSMDRPVSTPVEINYFIIQVSAKASKDYTDVFGTLRFNPGEQTKSFTIPIIDDELIESDETFRIILNRLENNNSDVIIDGIGADITIIDNDQGTLSISDLTVSEDDGYVYVNLSLTKALGSSLYVFYETVDQTATQPDDYSPRSDRVELLAGYLSRTFSFILKEDTIMEGTETFQINLLSITYSDIFDISLANNSATITILDDDFPRISIEDITIDESAGEAQIIVSSSHPPVSPFSVDFSTSNDTAVNSDDYLSQSGTLTFDIGEQTKTITVPIIESDQVEADEKFLINLFNLQTNGTQVELVDDQAVVIITDNDESQVTVSDVTVDETAGTATVTVSLDQPVATIVGIDYETANDTATSSDDYLSQSGTINFLPGEQEQSITISIVDTDLVETDEKFLVNLFNIQANGANLIFADNQAEVTIIDDDDPYLSISDLTVNEADGTASVIVSLEKPVNTAVSVDYITADQSALNSIDYSFQSGTLIFNPGEQSKTIEISILDNAIVEGIETFLVNLRNMQTSSPEVILADDQAEITIVDDDQATFSIDDLSVDETAGTAKLKVSLNRPVHTTVSVDFATADSSASNFTDYLSQSGTLTFFPGQQSKYITIPILDSSLVEGTERFFVNLTNIQSNGAQVTFADDQSEVTIMDDDQANLSINDLTVNEAAGTATLTVALDQPVQANINVDFSTVDQSAFASDDYLSHSGTLTFNPNEQIKTITISIIDSDLVELDETFLVKLSNLQTNGADILLIDDQAKVTVIDDDQARITINDISVDEHAGTATVTVSLDQPVDSAVSVDFTTADQSANQTNDYLTSAGTLTFNPGEQSKTITISIVDSDLLERDETFLVNLSNIQAGGRDVIFADDQAEVTIIDDETATARVDLRVVHDPTNTLPNGEAGSLPDSVEWVKEWSSYWVEVWVDASSSTHQGIFSVQFNLDYNTEYTSATEIQFGASFTQNQAGSINDATGAIEGLFAETNTLDLGSNDHLLFARIKFQPLAEDQVELDYSGKNIGPYDLGFNINSAQVHLVGKIPATTISGQFDGASIWANPYDLNDDDAVNFRDLMLFASVYNTIPSESSSDHSWFADLNQSDRVNFKDLVLFASNYGKRKLDHPTIVYPLNFPHAWNNQLLVDTTQGEPQLAPETLSQSTADIALNNVVEHVSPQLSPSQNETLEDIDIQVIDLQGDTLGRAVSGTIYIDADAAGYGWFVDATPGDSSEFEIESQLSLIALPDTDAAGRVDLWSVIMHELGHLLGYEHEDTGLMQDTLPPGVRRLPSWELNIDLGNNSLPEEADSFFLTIQDQTELVPF
ncbi:Calx-beta domain-containing protein [Gimesia aquarii]|nr:Calx-beta domain-containing protein [Gimesia aquarii]